MQRPSPTDMASTHVSPSASLMAGASAKPPTNGTTGGRIRPRPSRTSRTGSNGRRRPAMPPRSNVLAHLAELYQCSLADLVTDLANYRGDDSANAAGGNLGGLWHSRYTYRSSGRGEELHGEHTIRLHHAGGRLHGTNEPGELESRLTVDLSVRGAIATGIWSERTVSAGYYRGAVYHGTVQLVISPHGRSMIGR